MGNWLWRGKEEGIRRARAELPVNGENGIHDGRGDTETSDDE